MSPGPFQERAGVVAGRHPHPTACEYVVSVVAGRLRLATSDTPGPHGLESHQSHQSPPGTVLDVPVDRVRLEPLGRAGACVLDVDGSWLLVDFTRRDRASGSPLGVAGIRVVDGLAGRAARRRFEAALAGRGT